MSTPDRNRALLDEAARRQRHELAPATVTRSVTATGFTSEVEVVMDADTSGLSIPVANLQAFPLAAGTRVMVAFDPPNGAYVYGIIGGTGPVPVGRFEKCQALNAGVITFNCVHILGGGMTAIDTYRALMMPVSAIVSITARVAFSVDVDDTVTVALVAYSANGVSSGAVDSERFDAVAGRPQTSGLASATFPIPAQGYVQLELSTLGSTVSLIGLQTDHLAVHWVAPYQDDFLCMGGV